MPLPNTSPVPNTWTDEELTKHAERSLHAFVDRRLAEPGTKYLEHIAARRKSIERLFKLLNPIDPTNPDPAVVQAILLDDDLSDSLRYMAGPPISEDDLGVVVTRSTKRLTKKAIKNDPALAQAVLKLICRIADSSRAPWVREQRKPRAHEIKQAIRATAALHAAQTMQTERRRYGREVEAQLCNRLQIEGFQKTPAPKGGKVNAPKDYPKAKSFYGECTVYGRKTDLLIGLPDGRIVAVEAKDSSSVVNSVKRVLNDTAAKAKAWGVKAGEQLVPVALLSGVFGVENLSAAQKSGLYLVWAHDLDSFVVWLAAQ
ncbi:MAG: XamI family restriction endonuclease [Pseudomonadota bacterium]